VRPPGAAPGGGPPCYPSLPLLSSLFPACAAAVETRLDASLDALLPEEARSIERARAERMLEFRAGRHCARRALSALGGAGPVLRAEDRSPVWPAGFVGSIAHTRERMDGWAGAVVARAAEVRSLGLDAERDTPLEEKLWERVLVPEERADLARVAPEERGVLAKVVFSAKESFYKAQHPLSRTFLEFTDARVTLDPASGTFALALLREAGPFPAGRVFEGRWARGAGLVVTSCVIPLAPGP